MKYILYALVFNGGTRSMRGIIQTPGTAILESIYMMDNMDHNNDNNN